MRPVSHPNMSINTPDTPSLASHAETQELVCFSTASPLASALTSSSPRRVTHDLLPQALLADMLVVQFRLLHGSSIRGRSSTPHVDLGKTAEPGGKRHGFHRQPNGKASLCIMVRLLVGLPSVLSLFLMF